MTPLHTQEGYFHAKDGEKIFYRYISPEKPSETLLLLHGQGEHSGRYVKFADNLSTGNMAFAMMDLRGHGRSGGRQVYIESFQDYLDDVSAFVEVLRKRHGAVLPIDFFGHSLGGLIAFHWALKHPTELASLILSSPCLGLNLPSILVAMNSFLNRIAPKMVYSNPVYPPHLTHNPQEMEDYKKDGLIRRKITVRLLAEMIIYSLRLGQIPEFKFPFPLYVLMAEDFERVVDPAKTREIFNKISAPDKRLVTFPGFYHEIFNELDQKTAFEALRTVLRESKKFAPKF